MLLRFQSRMKKQHAAMIAAACRAIECADQPPTLAVLAQSAGMSPFHFQRLFTAATGFSPKAYASARRAERVREELSRRKTVTEALYAGARLPMPTE